MRKLLKRSDLVAVIVLLIAFIGGGTYAFLRLGMASSSNWQTNFNLSEIDLNHVVSGASGKDGMIKPIDNPNFVQVMSAPMWLHERTPVIAMTILDPPRAYPLTVLLRHEIVNDRADDFYFAVTYCPLCNSAIVYNREVDSMVLRMGVSGNLYNSGFFMYDDLTESWWQQFTGRAVVGDYTGTVLSIVPSQVVSYRVFEERYPNGLVLIGDTEQASLNYDMNPYVGYDNSSPLMSDGDYDERLPAMQRVLAANVDDVPVAYSFETLDDVGVVNDDVYGTPVVAFWQAGVASILDDMSIASSEDVGMAALFNRELDGRVLTFRYDDGRIFDNQTDSEWNIFGEAIDGELQGQKLYRYQCFQHFWFAWSSAYPQTLLYAD